MSYAWLDLTTCLSHHRITPYGSVCINDSRIMLKRKSNMKVSWSRSFNIRNLPLTISFASTNHISCQLLMLFLLNFRPWPVWTSFINIGWVGKLFFSCSKGQDRPRVQVEIHYILHLFIHSFIHGSKTRIFLLPSAPCPRWEQLSGQTFQCQGFNLNDFDHILHK